MAPMWRFWFVEVPAFIVTLWFRAYAVFLAALAAIMFGLVLYTLFCLAIGWPLPAFVLSPDPP
jgi:hypothetical protein